MRFTRSFVHVNKGTRPALIEVDRKLDIDKEISMVGSCGLVAVGLIAMALGAAPGMASPDSDQGSSEDVPVIVDPPGDANFSNALLIEEGPDTRPASDDRADILEIWPETGFETVKDRDEDGRIVAVRHVPRSLRVNLRTSAPARPATGPTLLFRLPVRADGCDLELRFHVWGPLSDPSDPPERASIIGKPPEGDIISIDPGSCIVGTLRSSDFVLDSDGDVTRMEFPFSALAGTGAEGAIAPGVSMEHSGQPYFWPTRATSSFGGSILVGTPIDLAGPLPEPFVIGSDVPPDIDCTTVPEVPACQD